MNCTRGFLAYIVSAAGILCVWVLIKSGLGVEYSKAAATLMKAVGDTAVILLGYWLLAPRWRWLALVPVWIFALWGVCNLAYFRFWGELIPAASVTMGGNVDGNLMEYGLSLLRWSDLWFFLVPAVVTIVFRLIGPTRAPSFGLKMKMWMIAASCLLGVAGQFSYFKSSWGWRNDIRERSFSAALQEHYTGEFSEYRRLYSYSGPVWYGIRYLADIYQVLFSSVSLSDDEKNEIRSLLAEYERSGGASEVADSVNVVYIIVESLNSDMVEKEISGRKVMPALDSLARLDGTVWVSNVESQIRASSSSDGHLLLLTGLLPPEKISYSITFGSRNKFPSLADRFPRHEKRLLLADDGVCWNEGNTLRNFGLGEPITTLDRDEKEIEIYGRDGAMFRQAAEMVKTLKQPFFMTLMTISMHIPFREKGWDVPEWIENAEHLSRMEKDYANTCLHTDMYIAEFLRALPANTMVFIASDHHQTIASEPDCPPAAMMMALHTPITRRVSRRVGQVNLFPAALDLLGIGEGYAGVAPSALSDEAGVDNASLARARRVSDLIIRGDYFQANDR